MTYIWHDVKMASIPSVVYETSCKSYVVSPTRPPKWVGSGGHPQTLGRGGIPLCTPPLAAGSEGESTKRLFSCHVLDILYFMSRKFCSTSFPTTVMTLSGWNCTPSTRCSLCRTPMTTPDSLRALTSRQSGSPYSWIAREW